MVTTRHAGKQWRNRSLVVAARHPEKQPPEEAPFRSGWQRGWQHKGVPFGEEGQESRAAQSRAALYSSHSSQVPHVLSMHAQRRK